ncbi:10836_t:CDS:2 [Funneliformis geosporum]|uniref:12358_t:CDS:1 n=1 Tax=Funneliformis geosporum TaxID=1117311 RepID=A0A9W4SCZ0_9GLOM|nr:10836_t:CDS:2 [Funneliformis geosporum]CAI2164381.1 12358_t:CDS:2 [Funneliformis geosporum]
MFLLSDLPSTLDFISHRLSILLSSLSPSSVIHTLLLLVVVPALVMIGNFLIPKDHVCSRTAEYAQPYSKLWNAIVEFGAYPRWRSNITRIETNPPGHIPPDGFEWFREFSPCGDMNMKFRVIERLEGKLLKREIVREGGVHFSGSWTIELESTGETSTRVTITEKASAHKALYKVMGLIMGYNKIIDLFLIDLGVKFDQQVIITDAMKLKTVGKKIRESEKSNSKMVLEE